MLNVMIADVLLAVFHFSCQTTSRLPLWVWTLPLDETFLQEYVYPYTRSILLHGHGFNRTFMKFCILP